VAETGAASIILPFSAIDGARIRVETIRPLAVRDDATWTTREPLPDGAPDLDELAGADTMRELDERVYADWQGRALETPTGTWRREYVWRRGGHKYTRTVYRHSHGYVDGAGAWITAPSWSEPVSDRLYVDGSAIGRDEHGYHTTRHHHRLGDSVFSAVIDHTEPRRFALPFESGRETARESVTLVERDGRAYCAESPASGHVAGPSAACIHCGVELFADGVWHRRSRYVSSFDYNEPAPLYFLAELPRSADTSTVDSAIESLAPRAVHAAMARGRDVARQGDIFYVETALTRETLAARGAVFARLTLFTRGAAPRKGEPDYVGPVTRADRRAESETARRLWRKTFRAGVERATNGETRHARPSTDAGARKAWRKIRDEHEHALELANERLRRAIFSSSAPRRHMAGRYYNETPRDAARREYRERVIAARQRVRDLERLGARDSLKNTSRAHARDAYRRAYGSNAAGYWSRAKLDAQDRHRPATNPLHASWSERRERARRVLAIYGTAHSATETATIDGAVYARGIARHVPELDRDRRGGRDHVDLLLGDGETWYLAIRNSVPRQTRRRRRPMAPRETVI
jgi:hypothetical protein